MARCDSFVIPCGRSHRRAGALERMFARTPRHLAGAVQAVLAYAIGAARSSVGSARPPKLASGTTATPDGAVGCAAGLTHSRAWTYARTILQS
jgi:hypothetical protein